MTLKVTRSKIVIGTLFLVAFVLVSLIVKSQISADSLPVTKNNVTVRLTQDGAPVAGALVLLEPLEQEGVGDAVFSPGAATNNSGSLQLQNVSPGTYRVFFFSKEGNQLLSGDTKPFLTVEAGKSSALTVNVQ